MIQNDIQNQLALLVKTSAPPLIEVSQSPIEAPQWLPGQRLPAHVIASLPNGRFQVQVDDQVLDMNLPRNSEPGQKLDLTFISASPRMTFALTPELARTLPSNSGVSLSETAKFLGTLLQRGSQENASASALMKTSAVLPGAPAAIREFAAALRTAVSHSGLFYESHQAQWVSGERTLASLMGEPQAQLPASVPARASTSEAPARALQLNAMVEQKSAEIRSSLPEVDRPVSHTTSLSQNNLLAQEPVHRLAQSIIQQQLETLDTRQILWQGQVWPGQDMKWEIEEDGSRDSAEEDEAIRWRTRLHLELPSLGGVTAFLALDGKGLKVDFSTDRDQTSSLMRGEIASLAQSLEASGLKVAGLMVRQDGGA